MKRSTHSILISSLGCLIASAAPADTILNRVEADAFLHNLVKAGAHFEANAGQLPSTSDFAFRTREYRMELMASGIELKQPGTEIVLGEPMQILFAGADGSTAGGGVDQLPFRAVHRISTDGVRSKMTEVPTYSEVKYEEVYSGIDVRYHVNGGRLEYDFIVEPGANPSQITFTLNGIEDVRMDAENNLLLSYPVADVVQHRPHVYQVIEGSRTSIEGQYVLLDDRTVRIDVGSYDTSAPLIIDPVLSVTFKDQTESPTK